MSEALILALGVALSPLPITWTLIGLAIGAKLAPTASAPSRSRIIPIA